MLLTNIAESHHYLLQLVSLQISLQLSSTQNMLAYILIGLAIVFVILYLRSYLNKDKSAGAIKNNETVLKEKVNYGRLRIFFGSQTGTAAKLAEQLGQQATEQGFQPQIVDLKDLHISHFQTVNQISLFLLSNTGEGESPENCVKWMKILRGKQELDQIKQVPWKKINFSIFGLGNTQYEHYNITAIDCDNLLNKHGSNRLYKLGLGDDNCSLQDDFSEWKKDLWGTLKEFRSSNPLQEVHHESSINRKISESSDLNFRYLSKQNPLIANYKIFIKKRKQQDYEWKEEDLDFKTKVSLKAVEGSVKSFRQLRQNQKDGSTLQFQIQLKNHAQYDTAGNIALYSKNDPAIVKDIIQYFGISVSDLDLPIGITKINLDKKIKLNFIPNTIRTLLEESIDLQGKLTKSVLKKLSKFESKTPSYFTDNSSKTTEQFKRITEKADEGEWYHLFRIIKEHEVKLTFQDFVQISDSMAPRLFTIASHARTQKNVVVAASIVPNGLISKYFESKPSIFKAELRKSTFTDAMKWKKVIFIGAGTGLAPFRAYIQQKVYNIQRKKQGIDCGTPIVSLFFGCKHQNGDFIYKEQILGWQQSGAIEKLHLAFSRDSQKKVYVQNLLRSQEAELNQLGACEETAVYICGSLAMGHSIIQVLTQAFGSEKVKQMQLKGRIVKQLW